jgi:hypothetical protein
VLDVGAVEQSFDGRDQNRIVGTDEFAHCQLRRSSPGARKARWD